MAIKNYTTSIEPDQTAADIQTILSRFGAASVRVVYSNRIPLSIQFEIIVDGKVIPFRLEPDIRGVQQALKKNAPPRYHTEEQARRVAWRIQKDWIDSQLAIVEGRQASLLQNLLGFVVTDGDQTFYDRFVNSVLPQLPPAASDG